MQTYETKGYYGSNHTACNVIVCQEATGPTWYCVEGSRNVNATYDEIGIGIDVESLTDVDCFTTSEPIESESQLSDAVES